MIWISRVALVLVVAGLLLVLWPIGQVVIHVYKAVRE